MAVFQYFKRPSLPFQQEDDGEDDDDVLRALVKSMSWSSLCGRGLASGSTLPENSTPSCAAVTGEYVYWICQSGTGDGAKLQGALTAFRAKGTLWGGLLARSRA